MNCKTKPKKWLSFLAISYYGKKKMKKWHKNWIKVYLDSALSLKDSIFDHTDARMKRKSRWEADKWLKMVNLIFKIILILL